VIKKHSFHIVVAVLLVFSVYSGFLYVSFSNVDDTWMLLMNELTTEFELSFDYFYKVFAQVNDIQYSPLNTLYYALIYQIDGFNPFYYHLFSILLHIANSILVFSVVRKILNTGCLPAAIIALIWAVHPLNVESVVWISASKILLFSFFSLLALRLFLKNEKRSLLSILKIFILLVLACLCKEQAVLTAFVIIFLDIVYYKKYSIKLQQCLEYTLYLVIVAFFAYLSIVINSDSMAKVQYSAVERVSLGFYSVFWYTANTFFPYDLHYNYSFPIKPGEGTPVYSYLYIFFWLYVLFVIVKNRVYKQKNFCFIVCALILISLCLHIVPMHRPSMVSDRYMYLPLVFILPAAYLWLKSHKHINMLVAVYLLYFSVYSFHLTYKWINLNLI